MMIMMKLMDDDYNANYRDDYEYHIAIKPILSGSKNGLQASSEEIWDHQRKDSINIPYPSSFIL